MGFISLDIKVPHKIEMLLTFIEDAGHVAVVAGGAVRDTIMGIEPHDWDIATSASPMEVISLFKDNLGCTAFATDKEVDFGRCTVIIGEDEYEITTFRTDGIYSNSKSPDSVEFVTSMEKDAHRRDFTMNALYMDRKGIIYDYVDGYKDILSRNVVFVGDSSDRIEEDPVRLLRYLRFTLRYDMLRWDTRLIFDTYVEKLRRVAPERIKKEIEKIFIENPASSASIFCELDLLSVLFDVELDYDIKTCVQVNAYHPEAFLTSHITKVFENLAKMGVTDTAMYWTALLHDLGKPKSMEILESGRTTFFGHEQYSAEIALDFMERFKFSNKEKEKILYLVENHMRIANVVGMKKTKLKKFINHEFIKDLCIFHDADDMVNDVAIESAFVRDKIVEYAGTIDPLVKGEHLIKRGLAPGPHFGGILKGMYNMQLENDLTSIDKIMEMYFNGNK